MSGTTKSPANLVIRPEKLGDLIVTTPVLRAFKESYPDHPLHLLTDPVSAELVRHDPCIDRILEVNWRGRRPKDHEPWRNIHRLLKPFSYDRAAILYSNLSGWNWLCAALGIRHVAQIGGTLPALLLGHKMVLRRMFNQAKPMVEFYLDVAKALGCSVRTTDPRLVVRDDEQEAFARRFPAYCAARPRIVIHPFFVTAGANYSLDAYQRLGSRLARAYGKPVTLVGSSDDAARGLPGDHPELDTSLVGALSIRELMVALGMADVVIGGASGIVHIAAALGTPVVALYCADHHHDQVWGPVGPRTVCLVPPEGVCAGHANCPLRAGTGAPCDLSLAISEDTVFNAASRFLQACAKKDAACPR
jgi:ADP-heptose:LPS heptosyltransferase